MKFVTGIIFLSLILYALLSLSSTNAATLTWVGTSSVSFLDRLNFAQGVTPGPLDHIDILTGHAFIDNPTTITSIRIGSGAALTINANVTFTTGITIEKDAIVNVNHSAISTSSLPIVSAPGTTTLPSVSYPTIAVLGQLNLNNAMLTGADPNSSGNVEPTAVLNVLSGGIVRIYGDSITNIPTISSGTITSNGIASSTTSISHGSSSIPLGSTLIRNYRIVVNNDAKVVYGDDDPLSSITTTTTTSTNNMNNNDPTLSPLLKYAPMVMSFSIMTINQGGTVILRGSSVLTDNTTQTTSRPTQIIVSGGQLIIDVVNVYKHNSIFIDNTTDYRNIAMSMSKSLEDGWYSDYASTGVTLGDDKHIISASKLSPELSSSRIGTNGIAQGLQYMSIEVEIRVRDIVSTGITTTTTTTTTNTANTSSTATTSNTTEVDGSMIGTSKLIVTNSLKSTLVHPQSSSSSSSSNTGTVGLGGVTGLGSTLFPPLALRQYIYNISEISLLPSVIINSPLTIEKGSSMHTMASTHLILAGQATTFQSGSLVRMTGNSVVTTSRGTTVFLGSTRGAIAPSTTTSTSTSSSSTRQQLSALADSSLFGTLVIRASTSLSGTNIQIDNIILHSTTLSIGTNTISTPHTPRVNIISSFIWISGTIDTQGTSSVQGTSTSSSSVWTVLPQTDTVRVIEFASTCLFIVQSPLTSIEQSSIYNNSNIAISSLDSIQLATILAQPSTTSSTGSRTLSQIQLQISSKRAIIMTEQTISLKRGSSIVIMKGSTLMIESGVNLLGDTMGLPSSDSLSTSTSSTTTTTTATSASSAASTLYVMEGAALVMVSGVRPTQIDVNTIIIGIVSYTVDKKSIGDYFAQLIPLPASSSPSSSSPSSSSLSSSSSTDLADIEDDTDTVNSIDISWLPDHIYDILGQIAFHRDTRFTVLLPITSLGQSTLISQYISSTYTTIPSYLIYISPLINKIYTHIIIEPRTYNNIITLPLNIQGPLLILSLRHIGQDVIITQQITTGTTTSSSTSSSSAGGTFATGNPSVSTTTSSSSSNNSSTGSGTPSLGHIMSYLFGSELAVSTMMSASTNPSLSPGSSSGTTTTSANIPAAWDLYSLYIEDSTVRLNGSSLLLVRHKINLGSSQYPGHIVSTSASSATASATTNPVNTSAITPGYIRSGGINHIRGVLEAELISIGRLGYNLIGSGFRSLTTSMMLIGAQSRSIWDSGQLILTSPSIIKIARGGTVRAGKGSYVGSTMVPNYSMIVRSTTNTNTMITRWENTDKYNYNDTEMTHLPLFWLDDSTIHFTHLDENTEKGYNINISKMIYTLEQSSTSISSNSKRNNSNNVGQTRQIYINSKKLLYPRIYYILSQSAIQLSSFNINNINNMSNPLQDIPYISDIYVYLTQYMKNNKLTTSTTTSGTTAGTGASYDEDDTVWDINIDPLLLALSITDLQSKQQVQYHDYMANSNNGISNNNPNTNTHIITLPNNKNTSTSSSSSTTSSSTSTSSSLNLVDNTIMSKYLTSQSIQDTIIDGHIRSSNGGILIDNNIIVSLLRGIDIDNTNINTTKLHYDPTRPTNALDRSNAATTTTATSTTTTTTTSTTTTPTTDNTIKAGTGPSLAIDTIKVPVVPLNGLIGVQDGGILFIENKTDKPKTATSSSSSSLINTNTILPGDHMTSILNNLYNISIQPSTSSYPLSLSSSTSGTTLDGILAPNGTVIIRGGQISTRNSNIGRFILDNTDVVDIVDGCFNKDYGINSLSLLSPIPVDNSSTLLLPDVGPQEEEKTDNTPPIQPEPTQCIQPEQGTCPPVLFLGYPARGFALVTFILSIILLVALIVTLIILWRVIRYYKHRLNILHRDYNDKSILTNDPDATLKNTSSHTNNNNNTLDDDLDISNLPLPSMSNHLSKKNTSATDSSRQLQSPIQGRLDTNASSEQLTPTVNNTNSSTRSSNNNKKIRHRSVEQQDRHHPRVAEALAGHEGKEINLDSSLSSISGLTPRNK